MQNLAAQNKQIEFKVLAGKIWKHKKELYYETPKVSSGFELNYSRNLNSDEIWKHKWNHPKVGISMLYLSFGDKSVLGHAIAIFPKATFTLINRKNLLITLSNGFGVAYINKTFNEINNPDNNAIGSKINNISKFDLSLWKKRKNSEFGFGLDFTHFSNGGSQSPNSGINVVTTHIGYKRKFGKSKSHTLGSSKTDSISYKKTGLNFQTHHGLTEDDVPGGPKYSVQAYSLSWFYRFSSIYRIHFGGEYEYHSSKYHFALNTFSDQETAKRKAQQYLFIIGHEFFIDQYSFRFQTGFYSNYPTKFGSGPFYLKLISQYHISLPEKWPVKKIALGVLMKSHFAKAEYLGVVFGFDI